MGNACAFGYIHGRRATTGGSVDRGGSVEYPNSSSLEPSFALGAQSRPLIVVGVGRSAAEISSDDLPAGGGELAGILRESNPYCKVANTIVNDVNVHKDTVRIDEDSHNPGFHLVSFSFDAIADGWICIAFRAREGRECSLIGTRPVTRVPFTRGLGQRFVQAPGTGVDLSSLSESELCDEGPGGIFPLLVRAETMDDEPRERMNAQLTHAVLEKDKEGNNYAAKVVKQTIYVRGARYELHEIYGVDNSVADADSDPDPDSNPTFGAKECVICLTELRDTTILPCRHMCMCNGCATVLRLQSNRCPICRAPVERLLQIRRASSEHNESSRIS